MARLVEALREEGYTVVGPTVRDGAIVYDELASAAELPAGWNDEQEAGSYRLRRRDDGALFAHVVGPHSWKRYLFPPSLRLFSAGRPAGSQLLEITEEPSPDIRYAFIGVRSCELEAIALQDRVFLEGDHVDPFYRAVREGALVIAVNCTRAGGTCFCASMDSGPRCSSGFDLALTEIVEDDRHGFLVVSGSERGSGLLARLPCRGAGKSDMAAADAGVARATDQMGRRLDTDGIRDLLYDNLEHPRWSDTAGRCLSCGNCTMVCPTCFCSTVEDVTDLAGTQAERVRQWDSCFTSEHSYIHGGATRVTTKARYRQWLTHKLASWIDQFGASGCVGCGRCITWCPVGIDITEEVRVIRDGEPTSAGSERG